MDLLTFIPGWVGVLGGTIAGIVSIFWAAIQAYERGNSETEKIKDQASKDLVKILQATVDTLKDEIKELQKANLENTKQVSQLRGENQTLLKILQGRDETYMKFQQEGFVAFKRINETHESIAELLKILRDNFVNK